MFFHPEEPIDHFSQILHEKRDKFRFQLRKERNDSLFSSFRSSFIQKPKKFLICNHSSSIENFITLEELSYLCDQITSSYEQKDLTLIESSLKTFKEFLLTKTFPSEIPELNQFGIYEVLNMIISGRIDTSICPEIIEHSLFIFIILSQIEIPDFEKILSSDVIENLFVLLSSRQMNDRLFLLFEAFVASSISQGYRDLIIKGGIDMRILDLLMEDLWFNDQRLLESMISLVKELYIIKPSPNYEDLGSLSNALITLLAIKNMRVVNDILFILSRMATSDYEKFIDNSLNNEGFLDNLLCFLKSNDENTVDLTLNLVAALTFGDFEQTYLLYEKKIIPQLMNLIETKTNDANLLKKVLIIMGNFFEGEIKHVKIGLDHKFFEYLLDMEETDYEIQREIIHCFVNASFVSNFEQTKQLVNIGMMKKLLQVLIRNDCEGDLMLVILQGFENIIKIGFCEQENNNFFKEFDLLKVKEKLENLLSHYNENVAFNASKLIEKI